MSRNKAAAGLVFSKHPAAEDQTKGLTSALIWWLTHSIADEAAEQLLVSFTSLV